MFSSGYALSEFDFIQKTKSRSDTLLQRAHQKTSLKNGKELKRDSTWIRTHVLRSQGLERSS